VVEEDLDERFLVAISLMMPFLAVEMRRLETENVQNVHRFISRMEIKNK
jgi:hypothetical protein